jgi:phosphatidylglycerol---prolipoprotein diacylglyceryl transferase
MNLLAIFYWDPARELFSFNIPLLGRPILWYGLLFALGCLIGHAILRRSLKQDPVLTADAKLIADKLSFYGIIGMLVGARLGDILFYQDWTAVLDQPGSIFRVWAGGLASHGAGVGILVALLLFHVRFKSRFPSLTRNRLLELVVVPAAFAGFMIRLGNFINQEILGTKTTLPWAVVFGHPADGSYPAPRHPVQLYESIFYLLTFGLLFYISRRPLREGRIGGLFLVLVFGFRFLVEMIKEEQSAHLLGLSWPFTMGQLLSLPFFLLGLWLVAGKQLVAQIQIKRD